VSFGEQAGIRKPVAMNSEKVEIERPGTSDALVKFASLPLQVYSDLPVRWQHDVAVEVDLISGRSPIASHLELTPLWARKKNRVVARVTAAVNHRYNRHWNEKLGQLIHFEAMPDEDEAVSMMLEGAVESLRRQGMTAARAGFAAFLDYPFAIDNYGELPPALLRGNPAYYHRYFKNAGFTTEKGLSDYTTEFTPALIDRYRRMMEGARRAGFAIQTWREYGFFAAIDAWTNVINSAFDRHWGWNPVSREEVRPMLMPLNNSPVADLSVIAVDEGHPVGAVFSVPDMSPSIAQVRPGFTIRPERGGGTRGALVNIGVLKQWRGRGVNLAMAARSFLAMRERGMRFAGYTLVVDDNWASRRTAERLGAQVTSNFVAYRRDF